MNNQITLPLDQANGTAMDVIIQAEWHDEKGYGIERATSYTIWIGTDIQAGFFTFSKNKSYWKYEGHLSPAEQQQIAEFIQGYKESDWEP